MYELIPEHLYYSEWIALCSLSREEQLSVKDRVDVKNISCIRALDEVREEGFCDLALVGITKAQLKEAANSIAEQIDKEILDDAIYYSSYNGSQ